MKTQRRNQISSRPRKAKKSSRGRELNSRVMFSITHEKRKRNCTGWHVYKALFRQKNKSMLDNSTYLDQQKLAAASWHNLKRIQRTNWTQKVNSLSGKDVKLEHLINIFETSPFYREVEVLQTAPVSSNLETSDKTQVSSGWDSDDSQTPEDSEEEDYIEEDNIQVQHVETIRESPKRKKNTESSDIVVDSMIEYQDKKRLRLVEENTQSIQFEDHVTDAKLGTLFGDSIMAIM